MLVLFFANALCSALSFQILGLYPELYHCNRNVSFIMLTDDLRQKIRIGWGRIFYRWGKSSNSDEPCSESILDLSQWIAKPKNGKIKVTMRVMTFGCASRLFISSPLSHIHQSFSRALNWQDLNKENSWVLFACFSYADVKVSYTSASACWSCFLLFEVKKESCWFLLPMATSFLKRHCIPFSS